MTARVVLLSILVMLLCSCATVRRDAPIMALREVSQSAVLVSLEHARDDHTITQDAYQAAVDDLFHRGIDWGGVMALFGTAVASIAGSLLGVRLQRGVPTQRVGLPAAMVQGLADAMRSTT